MSDLVRQNVPLIQVLLSAKKNRRKAILESLNHRETDALCEVILNGVAGSSKTELSPECLRHCQRHKDRIRALAFGRRKGWKTRRDLLRNQSGSGWFVPLLGTVLGSLLASKI